MLKIEEFPTTVNVLVPAKMSLEAYCNSSTALNTSFMQLHWFQSPFPVDGVCNQYGYGKDGKGVLFPVYKCGVCGNGLIVPFPQVERISELHLWFREHMIVYHTEDRT